MDPAASAASRARGLATVITPPGLGACSPHKRTSPQPVTARPPSPRTVAGWILCRPDTRTEPGQLQLKAARTHCPENDALTRHVRSFATMLTERLPGWLVHTVTLSGSGLSRK
ncbi:hypothetical protein GCM10017562_75680 [Streptomyces roseofulvus]|uniref:hypothetical protein n=1 Tax=Streptomyces roseofulvus TaxID=33902 RepID=UPI0031F886F9